MPWTLKIEEPIRRWASQMARQYGFGEAGFHLPGDRDLVGNGAVEGGQEAVFVCHGGGGFDVGGREAF